jgi:branched-chain amino acid transport system permease protein
MVYGILRLINFAHGDVFMLGPLLRVLHDHPPRHAWWVAFIVAIGLTALFGIGLERVATVPCGIRPRFP